MQILSNAATSNRDKIQLSHNLWMYDIQQYKIIYLEIQKITCIKYQLCRCNCQTNTYMGYDNMAIYF